MCYNISLNFFHFLQQYSMIIRSKFESSPNDRKKLIISNSRSSIFRTNLKKQKEHQSQKKESFINHFIVNSRLSEQKHQSNEFASVGKENMNKRKSISLQKKQNYQQQKVKVNSIISLLCGEKRQSMFPSIPKGEKGVQGRQNRKLKVQNLQKFANNEIQIVNFSLSSVFKGKNRKLQYDSFDQMSSFEYLKDREKVSPENSFIREKIPTRKSYYSQHADNKQQQSNEVVGCSNQYGNMRIEVFQKQNIKRLRQLRLQSLTYQIKIAAKTHQYCKVSVQVQTVQVEKEFFDYLRYKRKQDILEQELSQAFSVVNQLKEDRAIYEERISKFLGFDRTKPSNDREERVFKLKNEITKLEQSVEKTIIQKYQNFDQYVKEFQKIEESFATQNQKFFRSILKYKESYGPSLQPGDNDKVNHILGKVQKAMKNHLQEIQRKIYDQIHKGKTYNDEAFQLIEVFKDYVKTIKEQKALLKNCFGYIKKIPELCYGLLGDELPNLTLRKKNEVFEMPKCMQCFNSEWKMHMIIERSQLMQSIVKVTEELFK